MDEDHPSDEDVSVDLLDESQPEDLSVDLLEDSQPNPPRIANPYARVGPIVNPYARTGSIVVGPPPAVELHRSLQEPPASPLFSAVANAAMFPSDNDYAGYDENLDGEQRRIRLYGCSDDNEDFKNNNDAENEELNDDDDYNYDSDDCDEGTDGTIIPGTAYDFISSAA
jgi:hypothetical protein